MKKTKFVIISGGYIEHAFANHFIENYKADYIIAADSGMGFCKSCGIYPDFIIGDFDSAKPEDLEYFRSQEKLQIIQLNPIKDDTDTEFAIRFAIEKSAGEIVLLGATGTRLDHVMANVSLLGIGLEEDVFIQLVDAHNRIRMIKNHIRLTRDEQYGDYVSLLPYGGNVEGLTVTGAKYPLENYQMTGFNSLGISNEITEEEMNISLKSGYLLVIESRD